MPRLMGTARSMPGARSPGCRRWAQRAVLIGDGIPDLVVRKPSLKWEKAGHEPLMRVMATPPSSARTTARRPGSPREKSAHAVAARACRGSDCSHGIHCRWHLLGVTNRRPLWCRAAAGLSILPARRRPGAGAAAALHPAFAAAAGAGVGQGRHSLDLGLPRGTKTCVISAAGSGT